MRHESNRIRRAVLAATLAGLTACHPGTSRAQQGATEVSGPSNPKVGEPIPMMERRLELSGCAVVEGGVLLVEDELIGALLFASNIGQAPIDVATIKLERKKKARAPFAPAHKLFPYQDFEDIASDGASQVYVIGSHHGKDGERRPDREFLFACDWDAKDGEIKVVGEQYGLLGMIAPVLKAAGVDIGLTETEVVDTLNVEGVALHDGTLHIGLRSPLSASGKALLLSGPVEDIMAGSAPLRLTEIDLAGGGIRALDWDPVRGVLLGISGPAGEATGSSSLWAIDVDGGGAETLLKFDESIARKGPEGICRIPGGALLVALDGEGHARGGELVEIQD